MIRLMIVKGYGVLRNHLMNNATFCSYTSPWLIGIQHLFSSARRPSGPASIGKPGNSALRLVADIQARPLIRRTVCRHSGEAADRRL